MPSTYKKIASGIVGSGGAANIEFTSIPGTYTDLVLHISARGTSTLAFGNIGVVVRLNSLTTGYTSKYAWGAAGTFGSGAGGDQVGLIPGANDTASTFGSACVYIPNYAGSTAKSYSTDSGASTNSSTAYENDIFAKMNSTTSAITTITILAGVGNLAEFSTATLYGISKS